MKVDGRCHCGHIAFEADVDPEQVLLCHCTDCQTLHGSAFSVVVPAEANSFRLRSGEPTYYVKTADSGNRRRQAFCPRCGTRIYSAPADATSSYVGLRVACLRQRDRLVPKQQYWRRSAQAWVDRVGDLPSVTQE